MSQERKTAAPHGQTGSGSGPGNTVEDLFNITLKVAGITFPLTVERKEEEIYRNAEREVNDLIAKFKRRFGASDEYALALAAIQMGVENAEIKLSRTLGEDLEELIEVDRQLDEYMSSVK